MVLSCVQELSFCLTFEQFLVQRSHASALEFSQATVTEVEINNKYSSARVSQNLDACWFWKPQ